MIADVKWQAHDANDFDVGMEAACDNGTEHEELDLVSEYLGLLLDAPFLGPRKHIFGGPLYS